MTAVLYGIAEIAQVLDLDRRLVAQWHRRGKLPPATVTLSMGPVWTAEDIEPWITGKQAEQPCGYCGRVVPTADVPAVGDDAAWTGLAGQHRRGCEWVATRAHRVTNVAEQDI